MSKMRKEVTLKKRTELYIEGYFFDQYICINNRINSGDHCHLHRNNMHSIR